MEAVSENYKLGYQAATEALKYHPVATIKECHERTKKSLPPRTQSDTDYYAGYAAKIAAKIEEQQNGK